MPIRAADAIQLSCMLTETTDVIDIELRGSLNSRSDNPQRPSTTATFDGDLRRQAFCGHLPKRTWRWWRSPVSKRFLIHFELCTSVRPFTTRRPCATSSTSVSDVDSTSSFDAIQYTGYSRIFTTVALNFRVARLQAASSKVQTISQPSHRTMYFDHTAYRVIKNMASFRVLFIGNSSKGNTFRPCDGWSTFTF